MVHHFYYNPSNKNKNKIKNQRSKQNKTKTLEQNKLLKIQKKFT